MVRFKLDKQSPIPFYRQVVDIVLAGLASGTIAAGDKLPTIRELAVQLEVNPNTIVKAYSQLQMLGVLDTQQGSGVFVRPQPTQILSAADRRRALDSLCHDFVGRGQLLGFGVHELIEGLERMLKKPPSRSSSARPSH